MRVVGVLLVAALMVLPVASVRLFARSFRGTMLGSSALGGATVIAQADYISQADAICLESNTALSDVDQSDVAQAASDEAEIVAGELQQLQSLPAPDDGTTKLDNFLKALEKQANA